jgi:16S rRNA (guanine966-N2)-methyltransferase
MSRIVAGRWASRRLVTPAGAATRPTADRVREAVFAHVAAALGRTDRPAAEQLDGLSFLDLFAGSGAVGLEAAARGAAPVTWVERDAAACRVIERNRRDLGAEGWVVRQEVGAFLASTSSATGRGSATGRSPATGEQGPATGGRGPATGERGSAKGERGPATPHLFDLVWLDPPYDTPTSTVNLILTRLATGGRLAPGALVLAERRARGEDPDLERDFSDRWSRDYGDTRILAAHWKPDRLS